MDADRGGSERRRPEASPERREVMRGGVWLDQSHDNWKKYPDIFHDVDRVYGLPADLLKIGAFEGDLVSLTAEEGPEVGDLCLGQAVAFTDENFGKIEFIGQKNGEINFGVSKYNRLGKFIGLYWRKKDELAVIDTTIFDQKPERSASRERWENWARDFARHNMGIHEGYFTKEHNKQMFFCESLTAEQEAIFREAFIQARQIYLIRELPTSSDEKAWRDFYFLCMSEAARTARKRITSYEIHDFLIHFAVAIARRGSEAVLDLPEYMIERNDAIDVITEELGAISFGYGSETVFIRRAEFEFISRYGSYNQVTPEKFVGVVGRYYQALGTSGDGVYMHGDGEIADEHFASVEQAPPRWLIDIIWPLIAEHPDSLYNQERLTKGEVRIEDLNPNIGPELLEKMLKKKISLPTM